MAFLFSSLFFPNGANFETNKKLVHEFPPSFFFSYPQAVKSDPARSQIMMSFVTIYFHDFFFGKKNLVLRIAGPLCDL